MSVGISKPMRQLLAAYFKEYPGEVKKMEWVAYKEMHPEFVNFGSLKIYRSELVRLGVLDGTKEEHERIWRNHLKRLPGWRAHTVLHRLLRGRSHDKAATIPNKAT